MPKMIFENIFKPCMPMSNSRAAVIHVLQASLIALIVTACAPAPEMIFITATFVPEGQPRGSIATDTPPTPVRVVSALGLPTPDPTRGISSAGTPQQHIVQPGDTLLGIAATYNTTLETLLQINDFVNPDILEVGQVINLPQQAANQAAAFFKVIPDSRLVRAPGSGQFDLAGFISAQSGYIRVATDEVDTRLADGSVRVDTLSAAQIATRVSFEYSVDARILLALLEYRAGWLSQTQQSEKSRDFPLGVESWNGVERKGLYKQLAWAANELNRGYYGWKFTGLNTINFDDGSRYLYAPEVNAGTAAVQYFLSLANSYEAWVLEVGSGGFYATYASYFGEPFADSIDPLISPGLEQPALTLPFPAGQTWFYTGGHHGGWGSGSAWAAVDFAPPDDPNGRPACYTSEFPVIAVSDGIIARSEQGAVVLDLDGDGDESTGWTILYLHIASAGRIPAGSQVTRGAQIGFASCEGGFSTATHMHIARRYNGEWIPVECPECSPQHQRPPFVMSGWRMYGYVGQEYQGYMSNGVEQRLALEGRNSPDNRISW